MTHTGVCVVQCSVCSAVNVKPLFSEWKQILQSANVLMSQHGNGSYCKSPVYHNDNDYPDLCIPSLSHGCCHSNTSMSYQVQPL